MTVKKRKSGIELIKSLHELVCGDEIDNVETMPMEEVYSNLKKHNIDHERVITNVRIRLNKISAKAKLDQARVQRLALADKPNGEIPSLVGLKDKITELISSMQLNNPKTAAAFFRKFESAPDSDLESLFRDLQALQQLEKDDAEN
ncbi:MAG: hypothetical protein EG828_00695 [Deltaproteobacteria bacterium]|nr:hypothetical protein [Deltaproteobacteria bacterium]